MKEIISSLHFFCYVAYFIFICSDAGDSLNDCRIMFLTEIYKIEEPGSLSDVPPGSESPLKSKSTAHILSDFVQLLRQQC